MDAMSVSRPPSERDCSMRFTSSLNGGLMISDRRTRVLAAISWFAIATTAGCDKSVGPFETLPALQPSTVEPTAGTWRMILLTAPTQIAVAAPTAVSSAAYVAELDAIKTSQSSLSDAQRKAIAYW